MISAISNLRDKFVLSLKYSSKYRTMPGHSTEDAAGIRKPGMVVHFVTFSTPGDASSFWRQKEQYA